MQAGDLAEGPLAETLRALATDGATGALHVRRRNDQVDVVARTPPGDAVLYLREGRLYAATAPGPRPLLGVRLVAAGAVTREALEEALQSQQGELAGWRLGELLVHLGYVDAEIVAEFVVEQILDTVAEVSAWTAGGWRFRDGERTREQDGLAVDIEDVLSQVHVRRLSWQDMQATAGGAGAVPARVSHDEELASEQIPLAQTLLTEVNGRRTLAELATRCGLTTYEAGYVLSHLVESGLVELSVAASTAQPSHPSSDDVVALPPTSDAAVDLETQLAALARQAEEARWAAETRQHAELAALRRQTATARTDPGAPDRQPLGDAGPSATESPHRHAGPSNADPAQFVPTVAPAEEQAAIRAALAEVAAGSFAAALDADLAAASKPAFVVPRQGVAAAMATDYAPGGDELGPVADTASLLRELSFLGLEDVPASAPSVLRPATVRPAVAAKPKRKSIFGR